MSENFVIENLNKKDLLIITELLYEQLRVLVADGFGAMERQAPVAYINALENDVKELSDLMDKVKVARVHGDGKVK